MTASRGLKELRGAQKSREGASEFKIKERQPEQGLNLHSARAQPKGGPPRGRSRLGWQGGAKPP